MSKWKGLGASNLLPQSKAIEEEKKLCIPPLSTPKQEMYINYSLLVNMMHHQW